MDSHFYDGRESSSAWMSFSHSPTTKYIYIYAYMHMHTGAYIHMPSTHSRNAVIFERGRCYYLRRTIDALCPGESEHELACDSHATIFALVASWPWEDPAQHASAVALVKYLIPIMYAIAWWRSLFCVRPVFCTAFVLRYSQGCSAPSSSLFLVFFSVPHWSHPVQS